MSQQTNEDVIAVVGVLERNPRAELNAGVIASRLRWRTDRDAPDEPRVEDALELAERDGLVEAIGGVPTVAPHWRLARSAHPAPAMLPAPRTEQSRSGYIDALSVITAVAREWLSAGRDLEAFVGWADGMLPVVMSSDAPQLTGHAWHGLRFDLAITAELACGTELLLVPSDDIASRDEDSVPPIALILRAGGTASIQDYLTPGACQELGGQFLQMARQQTDLDNGRTPKE